VVKHQNCEEKLKIKNLLFYLKEKTLNDYDHFTFSLNRFR